MAAVNPYLTLNGTCGEAFDFYKSVFGGEFAVKMLFKDMPSEKPMPEAEGAKVMHVSLEIGHGTTLMGSDTNSQSGKATMGTNYSVSINADSEQEATKLFDGLSAGGKVAMPMEKTFWGAYFGMFTDKFGIQWMVNFDYAPKK